MQCIQRNWIMAACAGSVSVAALAAPAHGKLDDLTIVAVPGPTPIDVPGWDVPSPSKKDETAEVKSRWSGSLALDIVSGYFSRGMRSEDQGFIAQPSATIAFEAVRSEDFTWKVDAGTWHSIHSEKTAAAPDRTGSVASWFEADVTFGTSLNVGSVLLRTAYTFYSSPNDGFKGYEELVFQIGLDDSQWMGDFALNPVVSYVLETSDNGADGPGNGHGSYLEVSLTPGFDLPAETFDARLNFPVVVGFDLSDYYENAAGEDSFFGFVEFGSRLVFDLPMPEDAGAWSAYVGFKCVYLGDGARQFNEQQEQFEIIAVGGISVSF